MNTIDEVITSSDNSIEVVTATLTVDEVTTSTVNFVEVILDQLNIK